MARACKLIKKSNGYKNYQLDLFFKKSPMLEAVAITSLKILFVWGAMQEGNILFILRRAMDWMIEPLPPRVFLIVRKPLYDCLFCMASVWGTILSWHVTNDHLSWLYVQFLFAVAGLNYLIQYSLISDEGKA